MYHPLYNMSRVSIFYIILITSSTYLPVMAKEKEPFLFIRNTKQCMVKVVVAGVVGGGSLPVVLYAAGFTGSGITAGSFASYLMSLATTSGFGMAFVSAAQSAGAAGMGIWAMIGMGLTSSWIWFIGDCLEFTNEKCQHTTDCVKGSYYSKGDIWCCKSQCEPEILMCGWKYRIASEPGPSKLDST